jgi:hypothetical protein
MWQRIVRPHRFQRLLKKSNRLETDNCIGIVLQHFTINIGQRWIDRLDHALTDTTHHGPGKQHGIVSPWVFTGAAFTGVVPLKITVQQYIIHHAPNRFELLCCCFRRSYVPPGKLSSIKVRVVDAERPVAKEKATLARLTQAAVEANHVRTPQ